jgi:imidazolonepropionase-like amidohydrolase
LHDFGLSTRDAIAVASTAARGWLGLSHFEVGAPGDLITFRSDPRANLSVLAEPAAVLFNGRRVR